MDWICNHCGRPIVNGPAVPGTHGNMYHPECTHGPDYKPEPFATIPWPDICKQAQREGFAIGVLQGVLFWDIAPELKAKITSALAEIEAMR